MERKIQGKAEWQVVRKRVGEKCVEEIRRGRWRECQRSGRETTRRGRGGGDTKGEAVTGTGNSAGRSASSLGGKLPTTIPSIAEPRRGGEFRS